MRLLLVMFAIFFLTSLGGGEFEACAGEAGPVIPKANGDACARDPVFMRSNHMEILKHRRDVSVHDGDRAKDDTSKESLSACVTCHAVKDADNTPVSFSNPKHFCRTCHDYAAVRVDCFECHNSKPEKSLWSSWKKNGTAKANSTANPEGVAK
jgi:[DsrC]-trisulfide reductase subunit J